METYVLHTKTNRYIKKNGTLYNKLKQEGVHFDTKRNIKKKKVFEPVLDRTVSKKVKGRQPYDVDRSSTPWGQRKPQTTSDRKLLYETCGDDCFLIPNALKFPICNKIQEKGKKKCVYNCRGLKGASSRAGEWKYKNVLEKSKRLTKELDCYSKK